MPKVFDPLKNAGQVGEKHPLPDIDPEGDIFDFTTLLVTELDEGGKKGRRQVIDAEVPDVLETF
jgi:hypothetical protein